MVFAEARLIIKGETVLKDMPVSVPCRLFVKTEHPAV
jgi:hypothetical protein